MYFLADTKASEKLCALKRVCNIKQLSPHHQTSALESFHSVILHFAPKHTGFSYCGMNSRLQLASLHFNENANRCQAKTRNGEDRYSIVYPKYKHGGYIVCKIKTTPTYGKVGCISNHCNYYLDYVEELLDATIKYCADGE